MVKLTSRVIGLKRVNRIILNMRSKYLRELRKIDTTSFGITLPKKAIKEELSGDEEEVDHSDTVVSIELDKQEDGSLLFTVELHENNNGDNNSENE